MNSENAIGKDSGKGGIWTFCEVSNGKLQDVSLEMLGAARELASKSCHEVTAILLGYNVTHFSSTLCQHGADKVIVVDDKALAHFNDEDYGAILLRLIRKRRPSIFLAGATPDGRALIPRVAVAARCGLTADCTALDIDPESGALLQTRPAFGGSLMATIRSDRFLPQMATVRPGVMKALKPNAEAQGQLIEEPLLGQDQTGLKRVLESLPETISECIQCNAHFVIAGGRGMRGPEGFKLLERFASLVGGSVGASRAAVDAGWAPYGIQIGQTGRTVQPRVYIACGISGQIQHLVGMQSSDLIIAINSDLEAPIMKLADMAVAGDAFEILPPLIALLEKRKSN